MCHLQLMAREKRVRLGLRRQLSIIKHLQRTGRSPQSVLRAEHERLLLLELEFANVGRLLVRHDDLLRGNIDEYFMRELACE